MILTPIIYSCFLFQIRRIVTLNPEKGSTTKGFTSGGTMVRMLGVQQTNEVKATQNLAIIVLFFMICWIPLYTINCILAFRPDFRVNSTAILCCIILSHLNSAGNPILYAYHLRDFRAALKNFFCSLFGKKHLCEDLNRTYYSQYRYQTRKKSSTASLYNYNVAGRAKPYQTGNIATLSKYSEIADQNRNGGEINPVMWNISEHSSGSSDSSKPNSDYDKAIMVRPPTPFRQIYTRGNNPTYISKQNNDGLNEAETLYCREYSTDDGFLNDRLAKSEIHSPQENSSLSNSSPHLSRLFFIEDEENRAAIWTRSQPKNLLSLSLSDSSSSTFIPFKHNPFKQLNKFDNKTGMSRSFSDSGGVCVKYKASNGILSCGS